jgi:hypothetical protein
VLLGKNITAHKLVKLAGLDHNYVSDEGMDQDQLMLATHKSGFHCKCLQKFKREDDEVFFKSLDEHINQGFPVLLCIEIEDDDEEPCTHWITLFGKSNNQYLVMDPMEGDLEEWSEIKIKKLSWCHAVDEEDDDEYLAILISKDRGTPPNWKLTEDLIRSIRQNKLSLQDGLEWCNDLMEMIERSSINSKLKSRCDFSSILETMKDTILSNVDHWVDNSARLYKDSNMSVVRNAYKDLMIVASSASLTIPDDYDKALLFTQLSSYFTIVLILGELESSRD